MAKTLALIGNPNCGKTTLFNTLTGSNHYVGNWAGVTVEKKIGKTIKGNYEIVDLPGLYSLSPYSIEERVTKDFLTGSVPDVIINIIDGTNIERNLYLTVQLIELNKPMVVVVNMIDELESKGISVDCTYLSDLFGIPFVPISAKKNFNIDKVFEEIEHVIRHNHIPPEIDYDYKTRNALNKIFSVIVKPCKTDEIPYSFYAAKLLEGDTETADILELSSEQRAEIERIVSGYEKSSAYGDREAMLADARYTFIEGIVRKTVVKSKKEESESFSDKLDKILTNRFLAIPVFLLIMLGIFSLTFSSIGSWLSGLIETLIVDYVSPAVRNIIINSDAPAWTEGLLVDAVIGGVGGILKFLPQIAILFVCLSIMEDSGYMARAAFITDRFLSHLGLSGKSFIPMIMGFGCTTPAVMAARTQENINERRMTIMLLPFMSCGAKLPIYALFAGTFFEKYQGIVVFSMYLLGFVISVAAALILKKTLFKTNKAPFIMELPPYRMPAPSAVIKSSWEKCKGFVIKAGTVIFAMSIVIWLCQNFTLSFQFTSDSAESIFGNLGAFLAPIFAPLGFGNWQSVVALLSGLVAKEAVVSTFGVLYSAGGGALSGAVASAFTPLSALSFMTFSLLYIPCISAMVTIKKEMGGLKWAVLVGAVQMCTAYVVSLLVYQVGNIFF